MSDIRRTDGWFKKKRKESNRIKYHKSNPGPCYRVPRTVSHDNWKKIILPAFVTPFIICASQV